MTAAAPPPGVVAAAGMEEKMRSVWGFVDREGCFGCREEMAERGEWPGGGLFFFCALSLSRSKNTPPLLVFQPPPVQQNSPRFKLLPLSVSKSFPPTSLLCWVLFIEQVGVAFAVVHGSGSRGGWSAIGCYCRGSAPTAWSAAGRGIVSKRHCSNSFIFFYFFFIFFIIIIYIFLFVGTQKWVTTRIVKRIIILKLILAILQNEWLK
jgi:hypothetical protein